MRKATSTLALLNSNSTVTGQHFTRPTTKLAKSFLTLLEEEGGLVVTKSTKSTLGFQKKRPTKLRFVKKGFINSYTTKNQLKKTILQYKKPLYTINNSKIGVIKRQITNYIEKQHMFAARL